MLNDQRERSQAEAELRLGLGLHIVPMQLVHIEAVSELMTSAFVSKFRGLLKLGSLQLTKAFEIYLKCTVNRKSSARMVALDGKRVAGTIGLHWYEGSSTTEEKRISPSIIKLLSQQLGYWSARKFVLVVDLLSHSPQEGECYVTDVAVAAQCRGRGIGRALLLWAEEYAGVELAMNTISLHVASNNTGARRLYERMCFRAEAVSSEASLTSWLLFGESKWVYMSRRMGR